jgi:hypothetical protein
VNDIGGAIALALILGLIYGVLGHGLGWLSEKIEDWKNPNRELRRPLTEEQQQEVQKILIAQAASQKNKTTLIATTLWGILSGAAAGWCIFVSSYTLAVVWTAIFLFCVKLILKSIHALQREQS